MTIYPKRHTIRIRDFRADLLEEGEVVIASSTILEDRGDIDLWGKLPIERLVLINRIDYDKVEAIFSENKKEEINLRNSRDIERIIFSKKVLIDITSLRHNVWAPLVKFCFDKKIELRVLYVEPDKYKDHPSPSSDSTFDLTTKFEGLAPLPGFVKLDRIENSEDDVFVAMLGFEGSRPTRLLADLEPEPLIIPVIGISAFKIEYPTYTVTCNQSLFLEYKVGAELRHARASCPFEAFEVLNDIKEDHKGQYLYIAPVGTKPHALGAVIFHLKNKEISEILYDHPVGSDGRTKGRSITHLYDLKEFILSDD